MGNDKLVDLALRQIGNEDMDRTLKEYLDEDRGWCWAKFSLDLPASCLLEMARISLRSMEVEDRVGWMKQGNSRFSIKSAFSLLRGDASEDVWIGWKRIWRLKVQERAKVFMWLLAHDRVLSNWARWRRKLATSPCCDRCSVAKEDGIHAIRDCKGSREVWIVFLPPSLHGESFNLSLQD